jgi:ATP-dependent Clp protease ATP-binding subunit ClpB
VYGARPLKRAIQRELETPLARQILEGRIGSHCRVVVDTNRIAGGLHFETAPELAVQSA